MYLIEQSVSPISCSMVSQQWAGISCGNAWRFGLPQLERSGLTDGDLGGPPPRSLSLQQTNEDCPEMES